MSKTTVKPTNIYEALTMFRSMVKPFVKSTEAYQYKYVPIDTIIEAIQEPMAKAGIGFVQWNSMEEDHVTVNTKVVLLSDPTSFVESQIGAPIYKLMKMNEYQSMGAAITYMRRYDLSTILGLVSDSDTDGNGKGKGSSVTTPVNLPAPSTTKKEKLPEKEVMTQQHENYQKVLAFVKKGATVEACRAKYSISPEVEKIILKDANLV